MAKFYGQSVTYTGRHKYLLGWNYCPDCGRALCFPAPVNCSQANHERYCSELSALYPKADDPDRFIWEMQ